MPDEDINSDDIPELNDEFWKNARVRYPVEGNERLTIRFDEDMVQWFRSQGRGYRKKMNAVLRSFAKPIATKANPHARHRSKSLRRQLTG